MIQIVYWSQCKEIPRDMVFCAHAILEGRVLIVPDTFLDLSVPDNPLVISEPRIRFYAGCPLRLVDGHPIGTLCLIELRPCQLECKKGQPHVRSRAIMLRQRF